MSAKVIDLKPIFMDLLAKNRLVVEETKKKEIL